MRAATSACASSRVSSEQPSLLDAGVEQRRQLRRAASGRRTRRARPADAWRPARAAAASSTSIDAHALEAERVADPLADGGGDAVPRAARAVRRLETRSRCWTSARWREAACGVLGGLDRRGRPARRRRPGRRGRPSSGGGRWRARRPTGCRASRRSTSAAATNSASSALPGVRVVGGRDRRACRTSASSVPVEAAGGDEVGAAAGGSAGRSAAPTPRRPCDAEQRPAGTSSPPCTATTSKSSKAGR